MNSVTTLFGVTAYKREIVIIEEPHSLTPCSIPRHICAAAVEPVVRSMCGF